MTRARNLPDYLDDMLEAALEAERFVDGVSSHESAANREEAPAVTKELEFVADLQEEHGGG